MLNPSLLLVLLLNPPPASPPEIEAPDFADQIDHVDVTISDDDAVVVAFDDSDEPIGSLSVWIDDRGVTWLATDYADGYSLISVDPLTDEVTREGDLDDAVLAERAEALLVVIEDPAHPLAKKHTWGACAGKTVLAGFGCATLGPLGCLYGVVKAGCACVPKLVKEFEPYECPLGV